MFLIRDQQNLQLNTAFDVQMIIPRLLRHHLECRLAMTLKFRSLAACLLIVLHLVSGCAYHSPYVGVNPENPQFERGRPFPPLDFFGDLISKLPQLLFWTRKYGNHNISPETEQAVAEFIEHYQLNEVKVRINQWAPHKELSRLVTNKQLGWPYKILFFPATLIVSILARPFSGLLFSDYYDPGPNTINLFSDEIPIALHEAGHARDFAESEFKGTYALARILPGVNLVQENLATEEALVFLEQEKKYESLIRAYQILYPAYATYAIAYLSVSPIAYVGAITLGHIIGRYKAREKKEQLKVEGRWEEKI